MIRGQSFSIRVNSVSIAALSGVGYGVATAMLALLLLGADVQPARLVSAAVKSNISAVEKCLFIPEILLFPAKHERETLYPF